MYWVLIDLLEQSELHVVDLNINSKCLYRLYPSQEMTDGDEKDAVNWIKTFPLMRLMDVKRSCRTAGISFDLL